MGEGMWKTQLKLNSQHSRGGFAYEVIYMQINFSNWATKEMIFRYFQYWIIFFFGISTHNEEFDASLLRIRI